MNFARTLNDPNRFATMRFGTIVAMDMMVMMIMMAIMRSDWQGNGARTGNGMKEMELERSSANVAAALP